MASKAKSSTVSLFDQEPISDLLRNVRIVGKDLRSGVSDEKQEQVVEKKHDSKNELCAGEKLGMRCSVCRVAFDSVEFQREHFKLDWHRFNLKQKLLDKPILSEEAFEETISGEVSSISGSDSDTDNDGGDLMLESSQHSKLSLNGLLPFNTPGWRENIPTTPEETLSIFTSLTKECYWVVLMTAGGHFAGAVFKGKEVLTHKTFHRYTVRAKRGTAQSARDSQQGGKQPKSAGASLRRHNEAALLQEVQDLLEAWSQHVEKCHRIFIRTPTYNKAMFFGGRKPPFKKDDARIRTIPFVTRRPTFNEVKRVHQELSTVQLLGKDSDADLQDVLKNLTLDKPKEKLPEVNGDDKIRSWQASQMVVSNDEVTIDPQERIILPEHSDKGPPGLGSTTKLQEASKKTKKKKAKVIKKESIDGLQNAEVSPRQRLWNRLYCAIVSANIGVISLILDMSTRGDIEGCINTESTSVLQETDERMDKTAKSGVSQFENNDSVSQGDEEIKTRERHRCDLYVHTGDDLKNDSNINGVKCTEADVNEDLASSGINSEREGSPSRNGEMSSARISDVINEQFGEGGDTLLHVAARSSRTEIVLRLLECGADPAVKDEKGRTSYAVAGNKDTRNEFRRFMASYPDRYDYVKAQIPSALTPEMENEKEKRNAERKKAQKKAQKQRAKEQKAIERMKEEEEKEKRAYQALSDREKRALAAEKRFAQQQAAKQAGITSSCAWCSKSLVGQVPFERLAYKYCNTACVKNHRLDMESEQR
ncbi:ankyrin repeat and zinc finger domain-containing protein 1-like [Stylophora pistillata]|uniref:ankyrin repeat and zinc finger domain-containing protein 1-like n=1 Tax=Stylophora pistillata TaxID=50429 RepID=UPI000C055305|nr:ankyrin repeat and zinc finger domain-containing protein 1-like [Stylophora pistillata]